jgi:hypothetical protein
MKPVQKTAMNAQRQTSGEMGAATATGLPARSAKLTTFVHVSAGISTASNKIANLEGVNYGQRNREWHISTNTLTE